MYKNKSNIKALGFVIDSPGGSPVYSNIVSSTITTFCRESGIRMYTFSESVAASGGYWLLCAGDEVYAQSTSLVGNIGVITTLTNFSHQLEKKNIERRFIAAKGNETRPDMNRLFDLFNNKTEEDLEYLRGFMNPIEKNFKDHVIKLRGAKLTQDVVERKKLFDANVYIGQQAKDVGLVDDIGDYMTVLNKKYPTLNVIDYTDNSKLLLRARHNMVSFYDTSFVGKILKSVSKF